VLHVCPYWHVFYCSNCNNCITTLAIKNRNLKFGSQNKEFLLSISSHFCNRICCRKRRNILIILKCVSRTVLCFLWRGDGRPKKRWREQNGSKGPILDIYDDDDVSRTLIYELIETQNKTAILRQWICGIWICIVSHV